MTPTWKYVRDLAVGDVVQVLFPVGLRARVTKVEVSDVLRVHSRERPGTMTALAHFIDFEVIEGARRGVRNYVIEHPDDRARLA